MLKLLLIAGNPNVGVYVRATERHAFLPETASKRELTEVEEALGVPATKLSIGGSHVVGSLIAANSKGAVVADIVFNVELKKIEKAGLKARRLDELLNAAGNNILCNDNGALVNPEYSDSAVRLIEDALGVPVTRGTLGTQGIVGMAGVATQKGVLVHPKATPEEREVARRALGVDVMLGTINHGTALIGAGIAANSRGAVIGQSSTGVELNRIEDALGFLPGPTET
jgi:translation initiation factor 6